MRHSRALRALIGIGLLAGFGVALAAPVGALGPPWAPPVYETPVVCSGTNSAPGQLTGLYYSNVIVDGTCWVNAGTAAILGNLTIEPGGAVDATFALNDQAGYVGSSALDVLGSINVDPGASLVLGCEPNYNPCSDTPNGVSRGVVFGSIIAAAPLGVVVHDSVILGSTDELGGGGGLSCIPPSTGIFATLQSPVFSDFEDNWIGGSLIVGGLQTCWEGALRNNIQGNLEDIGNVFADPDANETLSNQVHQNIDCSGNSPQVQYGDSGGTPNVVSGSASGECSFSALAPNPAANLSTTPGSTPPFYPAGPLAPISVPA